LDVSSGSRRFAIISRARFTNGFGRASLIGFLILAASSRAQSPSVDSSQPPVEVRKIGSKSVLTDSRGMTLYVFDKDKVRGQSACNAHCAVAWPPLLASADAKASGNWSLVSREDGTKQWAYKDRPLYSFYEWDVNPGDTKGDGVGGRWHVARP
jgi:predicted lipoprotein with Yx(FWY)xxD motif